MLLHALDFIEGPSYEVIVVGNQTNSKEIFNLLYNSNQLNKVLIFKDNNERLSNNFSFLNTYKSGNDKPMAYVCKNYVCSMPTNDLEKIKDLLDNNY